ncbi:TIR domain-containing protein [Neorhizobium petrolearium]|uniref:TIR domain-containing protein n=1 Tax=Neorhizobium petrolearium TaxID=515361 RepID=UPI003F7D3489
MAGNEPFYDVAISFAGEDRETAEMLAAGLKNRGHTVFYDFWEQGTLWGKDLFQHLDEVYQHRSRYCVIIISKHYTRRNWPRHELRSAQSRAFKSSVEYVLPVRLDDTPVPGLPETIGYLDLRSMPIDRAIELLTNKIKCAQTQAVFPKDLHGLNEEERASIMAAAIFAKDIRQLPMLLSALNTDPSAQVRAGAALAIDQLRTPSAMAGLLVALGDVDWFVRSNVGWALVRLGRIALPHVLSVAENSFSSEAAEMAKLVLERMKQGDWQ